MKIASREKYGVFQEFIFDFFPVNYKIKISRECKKSLWNSFAFISYYYHYLQIQILTESKKAIKDLLVKLKGVATCSVQSVKKILMKKN